MATKRLVVFGAGGHAVSLGETLDALQLEVVAYVDPTAGNSQTFRERPVLSSPEPKWWDAEVGFTVAIGDNSSRERVANDILTTVPTRLYLTLVHPSASVAASARLEPGVVVLQNGIVGAKAHVRMGALVNSGAIVEHECDLGDYASLGPGAILGGCAHVGRRSAICIGATLKHAVSVGDDTVVGAGSYVHCDLPAGVVAYGTPATVRRSRTQMDPYLG